ncbi:hypothetical protein [Curvivirga sp.]|uniref:hypothetical protein n=1 Tax=Curvivirga sp. TaxID=2856848 RepID=UPI003B5CC923
MRILLFLMLGALIVGCTGGTKIPGRVLYYLESEYFPIKEHEYNYKFFVIANGLRGGYSSFYKSRVTDLSTAIPEALEECKTRKTKWISYAGTCRVAYLGNTETKYTNESELNQQIEAYISRLKNDTSTQKVHAVSNWTDPEVLKYACDQNSKEWNFDFAAAVNEAKSRNLLCK